MFAFKKLLSRIFFFLSLSVFIVLTLSSLLLAIHPIFTTIANSMWIASCFIIFLFVCFCISDIGRHLVHGKALFTTLLIFFYFVLIICNIPLAKHLHGETAIETGCVMRNIQFGQNQTCLFGYPDKQYYLSALPTILFGRSLVSLHIGGSLYFFFALVIFSAGVLRYYKYTNKGDALCAIFLASLLHFYYVHYFLFRFEQSIFPLSFGLALVGIALLYLSSSHRIFFIMPFTFFLLYLLYGYTPGLALFFLIVILLVSACFLPIFKKTEKITFLLITFIGLSFFFITLGFRTDIRVIDENIRTYTQIFGDVQSGLNQLVIQYNGDPMISHYYSFIFITTIILSAGFLFGKRAAFLAWWIIATIIFSLISYGYTYYDVTFRLHRSLVAIPIFFILLMIIEHKTQIGNKVRYLYCLGVIMFIIGIFFHLQFPQHAAANSHYPFIQFLNSHEKTWQSKQNTIIYFINNAEQYNNLVSLNDTLQYFLPTLTAQTIMLDASCMLPNSAPLIFTIVQKDPCTNIIATDPSIISMDIFTTIDGTKLMLFYLPK